MSHAYALLTPDQWRHPLTSHDNPRRQQLAPLQTTRGTPSSSRHSCHHIADALANSANEETVELQNQIISPTTQPCLLTAQQAQ